MSICETHVSYSSKVQTAFPINIHDHYVGLILDVSDGERCLEPAGSLDEARIRDSMIDTPVLLEGGLEQ